MFHATTDAEMKQQLYDQNWSDYLEDFNGTNQNTEGGPQYILPVVFHIIHNNGPENISDAAVLQTLQDMNDAFENVGYYDQNDGVNTDIAFCIAKRDEQGNITTGITRDVSSYTSMDMNTDDITVKDLNRWDPYCYINVWIVGEIQGGVAGYAYLPGSHGNPEDGIVLEAAWMGTGQANSCVLTHEMGHYLGLYHTFDGGCTNNDCTVDGDQVCDTPPDQSTAPVACNGTFNSCTTDAQSGFPNDVDDLFKDYMDYGDWNCYNLFTQGQTDRMYYFIDNVRNSLLGCASCLDPCTISPYSSSFTSTPGTVVNIGTNVSFTNTSQGGNSYEWYLNNVQQATSINWNYTFNTLGFYEVKLRVYNSADQNCLDESRDTIQVVCPVDAIFGPTSAVIFPNDSLDFTNLSSGSTSYTWYVNGVPVSNTTNFGYLFANAGNYIITLEASNGLCNDFASAYIVALDTCAASTFQKTFGDVGDDEAYSVRPTSDGGFVLAGRTNSAGSGGSDGFVTKTDADGNVQWSVALGGAAEDKLFAVKQTTDGNYIAAGETYSFGTGGNNGAWIVKLDAAGTLVWSKLYKQANANGEVAFDIIECADGNYAFIASSDFFTGVMDVLVAKLDPAGNDIFQMQYTTGALDWGTGIAEVPGSGNFIATGFSQGALLDQWMMEVDGTNGNVVWRKNYDYNQLNNYSNSVSIITGGYIMSGLYQNGGTEHPTVIKTDDQGNVLWSMEYGDGVTDWDTVTTQATIDGGFIMSMHDKISGGQSVVMKADQNGDIEWQREYSVLGTDRLFEVTQASYGSYAIAGHTATAIGTQKDVYFIKANLLGNTPGCNPDTPSVAATAINIQGQALGWTSNVQFFIDQFITPNAVPLNLPYDTLCFDPCTSTICDENAFQKTFGGSGDDIAYDAHPLFTGGFIVCGKTNSFGNGNYDGFIMRLDAQGEPIWTKAYGGSDNDFFQRITTTNDGGFVAIGATASYGAGSFDAFAIKVNGSGNIIWSSTFGDAGANGDQGYEIIQTTDGGYALSGCYDCTAGAMDVLVAKLNAGGNPTWTKVFEYGGSDWNRGLVEADNGDLIVAGPVSGFTYHDGYIMALDMTSGNVNWAKQYDLGLNDGFQSISKTTDGYILSNPHSPDYNPPHTPVTMLVDTLGNVQWLKTNAITGSDMVSWDIHQTSDGGYIESLYDYASGSDVILNKINGTGQSQWAWGYGGAGTEKINSVQQMANQDFIAAGYTDSYGAGGNDIYLVKTSKVGETPGCSIDTLNMIEDTSTVTVSNLIWSNITSPNFHQFILPDTTDFVFTKDTICENHCIEDCYNGFDDDEDGLVDCADPDCNCCEGTVFELGPDLLICENGILVLDAGPNFDSYEWQDGSNSQTSTVFLPGSYWCDVIDTCGNPYSDSLDIILDQTTVNLDQDTSVCLGDTINLFAPGGFVSYNWGPDYNLLCDTCQLSGAYPGVDTTYILMVETPLGCVSVGNVNVEVVTQQTFELLPPDTTMCFGDEIILIPSHDAGIVWQDGSTTPTYTVQDSGIYWLKVNTVCGQVTDTIKVFTNYCDCNLWVPNAFTPNADGKNDVFTIYVICPTEDYLLRIYNRWGEKVFETTDPNTFWNGSFRDKEQDSAVFVWYIEYYDPFAMQTIFLKGNVTLLR